MIDADKFEKYVPINKRQAFKAKSKKIAGAISGKLQEFKERNSDENRRKRIVSNKLQLEEENLKTKIHSTKQKRKGKGVISKLGGNQNPRNFGLQGKNQGFGAQTAKSGNADFEGLALSGPSNKQAHQGNFSGMDSLFGGGNNHEKKTRKQSRKKHTKKDGFSDLFS